MEFLDPGLGMYFSVSVSLNLKILVLPLCAHLCVCMPLCVHVSVMHALCVRISVSAHACFWELLDDSPVSTASKALAIRMVGLQMSIKLCLAFCVYLVVFCEFWG